MKTILTLAALLGLAATTYAHVTLEQPQAEAGIPYKAVLRIGHGCEGSPTRAVSTHLSPCRRAP